MRSPFQLIVVSFIAFGGQLVRSQEIYFTSKNEVARADLDGANSQLLVDYGLVEGPEGIAIDKVGKKIYWTFVQWSSGTVDHRIQRANLDGSQVERVRGTGPRPHRIALDVTVGKMYWTESTSGKIRRANLDGSQPEDVLLDSGGPYGLAIDANHGKIYWSAGGQKAIKRSNLDGSSQEILVSLAAENRRPLGLALDPVDQKLYWSDCDIYCFDGKVRRSNLNGSQMETISLPSIRRCEQVALDTQRRKLYWTDELGHKSISRANLDGSDAEVLVTGFFETNGIAIDSQCVLEGKDCQPDGFADACDLLAGTSKDCNDNTVPDECDIRDGQSLDCNVDVIPDECEIDCNQNTVPDDCDILTGTSHDCTYNGQPDECEPDCNLNKVPDSCDLLAGSSVDCDANDEPDECQLDCNQNTIPDVCDIENGSSKDCNWNEVPDECDIASGETDDCNENGIPDVCDCGCTDICSLPKSTGGCTGICPRYYFNSQSGLCQGFSYGCCGGNPNNFETMEQCNAACALTTTNLDDLISCLLGPGAALIECDRFDQDADKDCDLIDFGALQRARIHLYQVDWGWCSSR